VLRVLSIVVRVLSDLISWCGLVFRPRSSLEAEILFLRRQLALYVERRVKPRRIDAATRVSLAFLSRWFAWRSALIVVRPETLIRWHRAGFKLLWRWKSRPGRPQIPQELRELIRRMARENPNHSAADPIPGINRQTLLPAVLGKTHSLPLRLF
jgi:hypothetical protein